MLSRDNNVKLGDNAKWRRLASSIPIVALLLVGGISLLAINPLPTLLGEEQAYAVEDAGASIVASYSGYAPASVTLTLAESVSGEITPDEDGVFMNLATKAQVDVYNSDYYDLSIYGSSMRSSNKDAVISPITTSQTASEFESNTWGYSITKNTVGQSSIVEADHNTIYQPMPITSTNLFRQPTDTTTKIASDTYSLNFGAKVDNTLPAGAYSSEVVLSIVANPAFLATGFDRVSTMQELTPEICGEIGTIADNYGKGYAYTDPLGNTYWTKQLRDERDDKMYWVSKLKDGNCWMTQNLALDIPAEGLTSVDTALDLANADPETGIATWKPIEATRNVTKMTEAEKAKRFTIDTINVDGTNYTIQQLIDKGECTDERSCLGKYASFSWNDGEYVLTHPGKGSSALRIDITALQGGLAGWANPDNIPESVPKEMLTINGQLIVDVSGNEWSASNDPEFTIKNNGYAIDMEHRVYDSHYLIGNYYSWLAATTQTATEGQNINMEGQNVVGSVCPKNWQLPYAGSSWNSIGGSFYNLLKIYAGDALTSKAELDSAWWLDIYGNSPVSNFITNSDDRTVSVDDIINGSPLHFARTGVLDPQADYQAIRMIGNSGYMWSSVTMNGAYYARDAITNVDSVFPSFSDPRFVADPVRCLINTTEQ